MSDLNSTLGAALLGCLAAAIFYGVTSVQTLIYFQGELRDGWKFKSGIFALWVLDTTHMAFTAHAIYYYLIVNFGNLVALEAPIWHVTSGMQINIYITITSDLIVRGYFARRVSILCGRQRPFLKRSLPVLIAVLAVLVYIPGLGYASRALQLRTFERINEVSTYLYVSFVATVAADSTIAISLCALLFHSRTGIKKTDSILRILMAYSINTGLLTSVAALACLITYALWPQKFIFIGFYFVLSKLYVNSLLASLNARSSLREKNISYSTPGIDVGPALTTLHFSMQDRSLPSSYGTATKDESGPKGLNTCDVDQGQHHRSEDNTG
ncbi:hypothetical protein D9619_008602 [Psilocybe cf. subviscida]|uniref:DUF6534 domain-containing protein n=1 Tax=Psilocybe cf. subviscida TaxID=2480587 RepID=A0A8H5BAV3_9AGAR|nr:hypothetical protein D9619_008602 [Psilocybe cf. subviscida]